MLRSWCLERKEEAVRFPDFSQFPQPTCSGGGKPVYPDLQLIIWPGTGLTSLPQLIWRSNDLISKGSQIALTYISVDMGGGNLTRARAATHNSKCWDANLGAQHSVESARLHWIDCTLRQLMLMIYASAGKEYVRVSMILGPSFKVNSMLFKTVANHPIIIYKLDWPWQKVLQISGSQFARLQMLQNVSEQVVQKFIPILRNSSQQCQQHWYLLPANKGSPTSLIILLKGTAGTKGMDIG